MADCIHHLNICPDCGGLEAIRLDEVPGISDVAVTGDGGRFTLAGVVTVYAGPASTPCDVPSEPQQ